MIEPYQFSLSLSNTHTHGRQRGIPWVRPRSTPDALRLEVLTQEAKRLVQGTADLPQASFSSRGSPNPVECLPQYPSSGIGIEYRTEGKFFSLQHLHSKTKVTTTVITNLQHADNCAIFAHTEADLKSTVGLFSGTDHNLGLSLNIGKTKVLHQPAPGCVATFLPQIVIRGEPLENAEHFPYFGSHLSPAANLDMEIEHRICCVSTYFRKLLCPVFIDRPLQMETKTLVYNVVIILILL
uniref:Reverse transcriptase n=1 Tax=Pelusios castaneus TaxID=367368 RepID=A0A8C8SWW4_9SAUR